MKSRTTNKKVTPETLVSTLTADILNNVSFTTEKEKSLKTGKIKLIKRVSDAQAIAFLKSDADKSHRMLQKIFASVLDGLKNKVTDEKEKARQAIIRGEVSAIKNGSGKKRKKINLDKVLGDVKKQMLAMVDATETAQSLLKDNYASTLFAKYAELPSEDDPNA